MGQYEPDDSRDVTLKQSTTPGEPERTGPREDEARQKAEAPDDQKPRSDRRSSEADRPRGSETSPGPVNGDRSW